MFQPVGGVGPNQLPPQLHHFGPPGPPQENKEDDEISSPSEAELKDDGDYVDNSAKGSVGGGGGPATSTRSSRKAKNNIPDFAITEEESKLYIKGESTPWQNEIDDSICLADLQVLLENVSPGELWELTLREEDDDCKQFSPAGDFLEGRGLGFDNIDGVRIFVRNMRSNFRTYQLYWNVMNHLRSGSGKREAVYDQLVVAEKPSASARSGNDNKRKKGGEKRASSKKVKQEVKQEVKEEEGEDDPLAVLSVEKGPYRKYIPKPKTGKSSKDKLVVGRPLLGATYVPEPEGKVIHAPIVVTSERRMQRICSYQNYLIDARTTEARKPMKGKTATNFYPNSHVDCTDYLRNEWAWFPGDKGVLNELYIKHTHLTCDGQTCEEHPDVAKS